MIYSAVTLPSLVAVTLSSLIDNWLIVEVTDDDENLVLKLQVLNITLLLLL
ncbi:hypothetical protein BatF92_26710 [Bacteroides thetaiotaomicron]|uniref:Uncharacterized protein n=1 Tax=Bacteroides thetaiotaomicron TaxID=818 RepID=A0A679H8C6_BACT4|nr:hypothetical protein BatF92_26710 [Bacteroides thetaiotaomicron]